jgi:hypothetical protein
LFLRGRAKDLSAPPRTGTTLATLLHVCSCISVLSAAQVKCSCKFVSLFVLCFCV